MFNIIDRYLSNMTVEDIDKFAKSKNVYLSADELAFTYSFIKKNYKDIISNHKIFDIDRYKSKYSEENFKKIKKVYTEYLSKYQAFL